MLAKHSRKLYASIQKKIFKRQFRRLNKAGDGTLRVAQGIELKVHPESRRDFEYFCFRDPEVVREFRSFIKHTENRERFLDIGAAHGFFSLAFVSSRASRRAIAVEPSPYALERLRYNAGASGVSHRISVQQTALSDRDMELILNYEHLEPAIDGSASRKIPEKVTMRTTTGDALCKKTSFAPDAIKIDVEGHEVNVLNGLSSTISAFRPILFVEVHPIEIASHDGSLAAIWNYARTHGYKITGTSGSPMSETAFLQLKTVTRLVFTAS